MAIRNTADTPGYDWVLGGNPKAIERQEAQGQQEIVQSSQLPAEGLTPEIAARLNIQIIGPSKGDPLFVDVKLPQGMTIRATNHSMWTELFDGDTKVAGMFYKAAFYDRRAFFSPEQTKP